MRSSVHRAVRVVRPCPNGQTATPSAMPSVIGVASAVRTSLRRFTSPSLADATAEHFRKDFRVATASRGDGRRPSPLTPAAPLLSPQRKPVANRLAPYVAQQPSSPDELHTMVVGHMRELEERFRAKKTVYSEETFDEYDRLLKRAYAATRYTFLQHRTTRCSTQVRCG